MRYPQHLVTDYFKEQTQSPSYYWVNIWVQNYAHGEYSKKIFSRKHLSSIQLKFKPLNWSYMQPVRKQREVTLWNINFIRKEKVYTKLKYSRTQSYDIVSAGVAALFAGLLGFLICEKFGFELLDGGDFLFLFLYAVGCSFSLKTLIKIYNGSLEAFTRLIFVSVRNWIKWVLVSPVSFLSQRFKFRESDEDDE